MLPATRSRKRKPYNSNRSACVNHELRQASIKLPTYFRSSVLSTDQRENVVLFFKFE